MRDRINWRRQYKPRSWQHEALGHWYEAGFTGVVKVVTGGGKTLFAELCIEKYFSSASNASVVIVVPSLSLLDQWFVALQDDFGLSKNDISLLSSADKPSGYKRFNIAVVNSLRTRDLPRVENRLLIVDECHRVATNANRKLFDMEYSASLGLSATPERQYDQGFESIIQPKLGKVVFEYSLAQALRDEVLCSFKLINIELQFLKDEKEEYQQITRSAVSALKRFESTGHGEERLKLLLLKRARVCANAAFRVPFAVRLAEQHRESRKIVFHETVKGANSIYNLLKERGHSVTIYHSKIGPLLRRDNLRLFRQGMFDTIVCCRALDEGINVPEASVGIIASGTASSRQRVQRLGRVLRPAPGKDSAIVYTLYVTKAEKERLEKEANSLEGLAGTEWFKGKAD